MVLWLSDLSSSKLVLWWFVFLSPLLEACCVLLQGVFGVLGEIDKPLWWVCWKIKQIVIFFYTAIHSLAFQPKLLNDRGNLLLWTDYNAVKVAYSFLCFSLIPKVLGLQNDSLFVRVCGGLLCVIWLKISASGAWLAYVLQGLLEYLDFANTTSTLLVFTWTLPWIWPSQPQCYSGVLLSSVNRNLMSSDTKY